MAEPGNATSNALRLTEILEDPALMAQLKEALGIDDATLGGVPKSFLSPGAGAQRGIAPLQFNQWSTPQSIMASSGAPAIQPAQSGNIQFLGGSPIPVDRTMQTAALMSLGTNLLEAYRAVQTRREDRKKATG